MNIITSFLTNNPSYKTNRKITVKGLMIHSIGVPQPDATAIINNMNKSNANVSIHGVIDGNNGRQYQTLPWNHRAWHCGSGKNGSGNNTHIGVEMCEPSTIKYTGGASYVDRNPEKTREVVLRTYNSAVELFAYLCKQFKLNPLNDGVVISHSEGNRRGIASNHSDVEHLWKKFGLSMNQFRQDIKNKMENKEEKKEEEVVTQDQWIQMYNNFAKTLQDNDASSWSEDARKWCLDNKIVVGDGTSNYMWEAPLTREMMCAMLYKFAEVIGKK